LIDLDAAKDALLASINTLAPSKERYLANHLHRYALTKTGTLQASVTAAALLRNDEGIPELLRSIERAIEELDSLLDFLSRHPEAIMSGAVMDNTRRRLADYYESLYKLQQTDLSDVELRQALHSTLRSYEKSLIALMSLRHIAYDIRPARPLLDQTVEFWHSVRQLLQDTDRLLLYLRRPLRQAGYGEPEGFKRVDLAISRLRKKVQAELLRAGGGRGY
jgi:hypothetical protein